MTDVEDRFWSKVRIGDGCWEWAASIGSHGYGQMRFGGRPCTAHRLAWMFERGPIPAGVHVLHRCDNPRCVRPGHLFVGTHADNMADMASKLRHGTTKLTCALVCEIRTRADAGESFASIARRLSIGDSAVSKAVSRRTWRHVP